jgi:hypothetical protein
MCLGPNISYPHKLPFHLQPPSFSTSETSASTQRKYMNELSAPLKLNFHSVQISFYSIVCVVGAQLWSQSWSGQHVCLFSPLLLYL